MWYTRSQVLWFSGWYIIKKRGDWDLVNEEMRNKVIMDGILPVIITFMPYMIPFLTTALVVWVIKKMIEKFTYGFSIISGDSKRIARKTARKMGNVVDMISSFKDITESIKK